MNGIGWGMQTWSVGGLLLAVSDALNARFAAVSVRGELASFTRAASGHCYFTLKDAEGEAGLRCAMFRRAAAMLSFAAREGQQVEVRGRLAVYEPRGELQLVVESMQLQGQGQLYEEFLRLKAKLEAQGLFDVARKRALPAHPRVVAVVTSLAGAALHDVVTTLRRRAPQVAVHVYPSVVQGAEAPAALVQALAAAQRDAHADVVLLCRGGGSLEDLWAFNDERVVRAVAACTLPLVCGVGHETDVCLSDLAADVRAATPTAAAELIAPERDALLQDLAQRQQRLRLRVLHRLDASAQRLDNLALRLQRPAGLLHVQAARLSALQQRHQTVMRRALDLAQHRLQQGGQRAIRVMALALERRHHRRDAMAARLAAVDPRQVLQRGYAWVTDETGRAVTSARGLQAGQSLQAVWHDGQVSVEVKGAGTVP